MVGIKRIILTITLAVATCVQLVAQSNSESFAERQCKQLRIRQENVNKQLTELHKAHAATPSDSISVAIYELNKQSIAIGNAINRLSAQIEAEKNAKMQEEIPLQDSIDIAADVDVPAVTPQPESIATSPTTEENSAPTLDGDLQDEVTENEPTISNNLKSLFTTSSRRYALIESEINALVDEYASTYESALASLDGYAKSTNMKQLDGHYKAYLEAVAGGEKIAQEIITRGERLLDSKKNSYLGFADSIGMDMRSSYESDIEALEDMLYGKMEGKCSNMELAIYPHKLHHTLKMEITLAEQISPERVDSLKTLAENYDFTTTLFAPLAQPKRSDAKFAGVSVQKKAKHGAVSALPQLKIPASGELYSITVANYASLPPSTKVFRNVTPLYRDRREDGRTYICVGLYPTALSAQDDLAYLRKLGFKQPELVMWRDGIRRDDYVDRTKSQPTTSKISMYRVEISGAAGALSDEVVATIQNNAPRKEISKFTNDGTTIYTVGIFTKESEAHILASAIGSIAPELTITVNQIGKK